MTGKPPGWVISENYCSGNSAAKNGLDIRMYVDASGGADADPVGRSTASAVRFGCAAGASVFPGGGAGVHSGAVQAAMDEITAICCRVWRAPGCTTRKISHEVAGPAYQFRTYRAVCRIEGVKNDGALLVVKATLLDLLGEVVCTTISEMLDFERMMMLQH
eukprot:CAMPEP_0204552312 /NCGR_PEP_ID=MMETSP0661-20131031/26523_1 /ASSEMBLY_ACC=CAM_ASM_000606 /TAXON_ID=109239 /ORGANISM="Alexandrium margalefi, Strain AMGDE01CS-322" /LENGTH=160 /DNA_ID=CAMNT_0051559319 /DNA_START=8 /DNA_END=487 /DNA_ORIENTATION=-